MLRLLLIVFVVAHEFFGDGAVGHFARFASPVMRLTSHILAHFAIDFHGPDAGDLFLHRHEADNSQQNALDGPRRLPILRVIVRKRQTDFSVNLKPP